MVGRVLDPVPSGIDGAAIGGAIVAAVLLVILVIVIIVIIYFVYKYVCGGCCILCNVQYICSKVGLAEV